MINIGNCNTEIPNFKSQILLKRNLGFFYSKKIKPLIAKPKLFFKNQQKVNILTLKYLLYLLIEIRYLVTIKCFTRAALLVLHFLQSN